MGDWLGTGTIAPQLRQFRSFAKARAFVRRLKLKNVAEWRALCRGDLKDKGVLPPDIPQAPERTYANEGWVSTGNWLGTGTVAPQLREYRSFSRARAFARSLHLIAVLNGEHFAKAKSKQRGRYHQIFQQLHRSCMRAKGGRAWATGSGQEQSPTTAELTDLLESRGHLPEVLV